MRKFQYSGHKRKCRRNKEDGKIEEILDRRDARTDVDGPGGAPQKKASMAKYDRRHPLRGGDQCRRLASTGRPEADSFANGPTDLSSCRPAGPTT